jgi:hypothetical protein
MDGAGAAQPGATTVFGAGQADVIADDPEQRRVGGGIDGHRPAVQRERDHEPSLKMQTFPSDTAGAFLFSSGADLRLERINYSVPIHWKNRKLDDAGNQSRARSKKTFATRRHS